MSKDVILYTALYCGCIYESSNETISVHRTKRGAEMAIDFHKNEALKEHKKMEFTFPFGEHENWSTGEIKLEE